MVATNGIGNLRGSMANSIAIFTVLGGLYLLSLYVHAHVLQVPGYLLVAFASLIRNAVLPGLGGTAWRAFFAGYLLVLSLVLGIVTHRIRTRR